MAKQIRFTLSISPELKHALDELNAATGVAAASFVGQIIENSIPVFLALAEAARKANEEPAKALQIMHKSMLEAIHGANETQMELMEEQLKLRPFTHPEGKK